MLQQILSVYIEALIITSILVAVAAGLWIGWRVMRHKDKTAKERQSHLFDVLLIAIMTTPILTFATVGIIMVLRA
ncbi:DUF4059 family protein [Streptococcus massiliensis]|uniref:Amino acid transporter, AAT family n=1 Tax=Streptococcus massiliensis TaxID=313439 RepID=A0A380KXD2_9STRE|nr:DUF4059 family protein [Streptococcus massiliensis]SUN76613.1 amino acid transporter, AAT family [Streptococcus massiliensis]